MLHSGLFGQRSIVIIFMVSGLVLGGCQISTAPQDISHFSTRAAATEDVAAYNGTYDLYGDDPDQSIGPLMKSVRLKQGEIVGFEVGEDKVPYAVAGKERIPLKDGRYRWQMTPIPARPIGIAPMW